MRIFVDSLIILIPKYEIEVLIPIHSYFIFSRYHSVAFPKLSSFFSLAITITVILFFLQKVALPGEHFFLLDVISGTIWFVYLQKFGFRVVNCCFFWHMTLGPSPGHGWLSWRFLLPQLNISCFHQNKTNGYMVTGFSLLIVYLGVPYFFHSQVPVLLCIVHPEW
jgi:hypothetical protein